MPRKAAGKSASSRGGDAAIYRAKRAESNATNLLRSAVGREIGGEEWEGEAPAAAELELWARCRYDLRLFLETFAPHAFPLAWSDDQLRVIAAIQRAILEGGCLAIAMPRGSGKTTLLWWAALWALLYGHRNYPVIIGATEDSGDRILAKIKGELQDNELLRRPFRQVCYPIRKLEGETRRANGQLFEGQRTQIGWKDRKLVLPTMPDEACLGVNVSGACITVVGLTGNLRGLQHRLAGGVIIRPDLVLLDDPQTRESAMSAVQTESRLAIIKGDVLGLAGPTVKISAFCACTVIRDGDLADQLLDRGRHPEWQGERTAAVYAWPTNEKLWAQYLELRGEGLRTGKGTAAATAFYLANRAAMDAGARLAWAARHPGAESAVQWAIDQRQDLGEPAFHAEYQNAPLRGDDGSVEMLTASEIAARVNGYRRGIIPAGADHVTAMIDVGDKLLHWVVAAWSSGFTGWVVSYGVYPDQGSSRATSARKAVRTLADKAPGAGREGAIRAGLDALVQELLGQEWQREDGAAMRIERLLIDSGYVPDVVHDVCRTAFAGVVPSRGRYIGAKHVPMDEFSKRPGEKIGHRWHIPVPARGRSTRAVVFDSNSWKSFVHARLATAPGDVGALSLWGKDPRAHMIFAEHLVAEFATRVSANGRTVDEWQLRPGGENHLLDGLVGAAVAASMLGCALAGATLSPKRRQAISLQQLQAQRRGGKAPLSLAKLQARR